MPRYNVEYNGKFACFSSIVDNFVSEFTDKESYEKWRKVEYGKSYRPLEECNRMSIEEAVLSIRIHNGHGETFKILINSGLPETDTTRLLRSVESKEFRPIKKEAIHYECPICGRMVFEEEKECSNCYCELYWGDNNDNT